MSENTQTTAQGSIFPGLLFLLFLGLKLTGHISWSWWWVTAPLWGPLALALVIVLVAFLVALATQR